MGPTPSDINFEREGEKLLAQLAKQNQALDFGRRTNTSGGKYADLHLLYEDQRTGGRVYCGNICASKNLNTLRQHNISNVVNCQGKATANTFENEEKFSYKRFRVAHWKRITKQRGCTALEFAMPTFKFIDAAVGRGEGTLIHCLAGAHRAGTTTVAYLMYKLQLSKAAAVKLAKNSRAIIDPMAGLMDFLDAVEPLLATNTMQESQSTVAGTGEDTTITETGRPTASQVAEHQGQAVNTAPTESDVTQPDEERPAYSFDINDGRWKQYLSTNGFVVIAAAMPPLAVREARQLMWTDIDRLWPTARERSAHENEGGTPALKLALPSELSTVPHWMNVKGISKPGIVPQLAQSAGAWAVRGAPLVRKAFAKIWNCQESDLITSMDCVILWRPWGRDPENFRQPAPPRPHTEGMHLDQNPFTKPHLDTVQGMVPLRPVTDATGGLAVVPGSHRPEVHDALKQRHPHLKYAGDWCPLPRHEPLCRSEARLLVKANPGDLILWDARTVHGGVVGHGCVPSCRGTGIDPGERIVDSCINEAPTRERTERERWRAWKQDFVRMSVTVAMTERSRASADVLRLRREGFEAGISFNHTPHEAGTSTGTLRCLRSESYEPCSLTAEQSMLIDGTVQ